jgi:Ca2+-transporting ATPase
MQWYQRDEHEALRELNTSEHGLASEEARTRLLRHGPNKLAEEERVSKLRILLHQFTSPLIYILLIAAAVTFLLREYIDSGVIITVVLLNAIIGFIQTYKAEESVRALKRLTVPRARVFRDGVEREINSEELVPGDIVVLTSGSRVPADLRLVHCLELKVDEAMLTGESLPAEKRPAALAEENLTPGDQRNMAFMGTLVVYGRARAVVTATGSGTVLGTIAREVRDAGTVKAPIQAKIEGFARAIGGIVLAAAAALFALGTLLGGSAETMFMIAVAAAVAAVPEGMPIVVTVAMAIGVARMARYNAIIRKLPAVETLGSTTVICSDKTGTLTKNEMTVTLVSDGSSVYEVTGIGYEPRCQVLRDGTPVGPDDRGQLAQVLRIGLLCNESDVYEEDGGYKVDGDPTEAALIVSALKAGLRREEETEQYSQSALIPFESERGYMATLNRHDGKAFIFVKGGPERVLAMCAEGSGGAPLDRDGIHQTASRFAGQGLRVLAFAWKQARPGATELTHRDVESGLVFAGLQGMMDPPRTEAIEAVRGCRQAGIRVVMITGDHAVTAGAVAKSLGIGKAEAGVLSGRELEAMSDEDLYCAVNDVSVFARVAPQHKLRITQQLIKRGEIVAMTGDGVNDAPALKAAHIGIAMGKSGTDVAKEASDMVLADDNFASIFHAVREGRIMFDNLRKVVFFLIPTGVAAILSILCTMLMGLPIPYLPAQLLWINLVTNGLQDVALAFEPGEKGVLERPPRNPSEHILSRLLVERTVIVGLVISAGVVFTFTASLKDGASLEKARSVAMTTMVFFQFFQAWNSRSERLSVLRIPVAGNPFLLYSMLAAFAAQLAVLYAPALQWVFRTEPLVAVDWARIILAAFTVILVVEFDKWIRRRAHA